MPRLTADTPAAVYDTPGRDILWRRHNRTTAPITEDTDG
jgi:hypothetical protein